MYVGEKIDIENLNKKEIEEMFHAFENGEEVSLDMGWLMEIAISLENGYSSLYNKVKDVLKTISAFVLINPEINSYDLKNQLGKYYNKTVSEDDLLLFPRYQRLMENSDYFDGIFFEYKPPKMVQKAITTNL